MNKDSEEYKTGFRDGLIHAKIMMEAVVQVNIDFSDVVSSLKLKGDKAFILPKQEDKK